MKNLVFITLLAITTAATADGPGTRIRATPELAGPVDKDLQRCESMEGAQKERCLRAPRSATRGAERAPHQGPGPESPGPGATSGGTGASSGTGGASSGTSGASSAVGGAR